MEYQQVSKYCSEIFVSQECGVGFGNSLFSLSYLPQVLTVFMTCIPENWDRAVRFLVQTLFFSEFSKDRIVTVAKNLLSNILDIKRDGNSVLGAVSNRVSCSPAMASKLGSNECAISIFHQESFLKKIIKDFEVFISSFRIQTSLQLNHWRNCALLSCL
jgi:hypothetical protein